MSEASKAWTVLAAIALWMVTACFVLGDAVKSWGMDLGAGFGDFILGFGVLMTFISDAFSWLPWAGALFCIAALVVTWLATRTRN